MTNHTEKSKGNFAMIPNDAYEAGLGVYGLAIYCLLKRYANSNGVCYPSQELLAKKLGISRQTVLKYINVLIRRNILGAVKVERSPGGRWKSNTYRINYPQLWDTHRVQEVDKVVRLSNSSQSQSDLHDHVKQFNTNNNQEEQEIMSNSSGTEKKSNQQAANKMESMQPWQIKEEEMRRAASKSRRKVMIVNGVPQLVKSEKD